MQLSFTPAGLLIEIVDTFQPFMVLPIFASVGQLLARSLSAMNSTDAERSLATPGL